jgi:leader peptidase (prepilin peptidase)/N-methyltransferase
LLHSILSLILAVLTGVMLFGVRRQDFSSIRLPLAPFFCIGGVTAYWLAAAAAVI